MRSGVAVNSHIDLGGCLREKCQRKYTIPPQSPMFGHVDFISGKFTIHLYRNNSPSTARLNL